MTLFCGHVVRRFLNLISYSDTEREAANREAFSNGGGYNDEFDQNHFETYEAIHFLLSFGTALILVILRFYNVQRISIETNGTTCHRGGYVDDTTSPVHSHTANVSGVIPTEVC